MMGRDTYVELFLFRNKRIRRFFLLQLIFLHLLFFILKVALLGGRWQVSQFFLTEIVYIIYEIFSWQSILRNRMLKC